VESGLEGGGLILVGKWLNQLRENAKSSRDPTDKTDKTAPSMVLSVSSGRSDGFSKSVSASNREASSVSFVSSPSEPFHDFRAFNDRCAWDAEDWQAAFDERAAILEFDEGMRREEAETVARDQIAAERKRRLQ
jgi:hypothetical protein